MDKSNMDEKTLNQVTDIDKVVHEPARLLLLAYLSFLESADFIFLMNQTGLTRGNLSSHLTKLEGAGYIDVSKEFVNKIPRTMLRITEKGRKALLEYRENMQSILESLP